MFRVGQKVVCINAKVREKNYAWIWNDAPTEGVIYTIEGEIFHDDELCLVLAEQKRSPNSKYLGYAAWRFRPIVERKTDISIFTKMLTPNKRSVDA